MLLSTHVRNRLKHHTRRQIEDSNSFITDERSTEEAAEVDGKPFLGLPNLNTSHRSFRTWACPLEMQRGEEQSSDSCVL